MLTKYVIILNIFYIQFDNKNIEKYVLFYNGGKFPLNNLIIKMNFSFIVVVFRF
jgi:hypothetical protein